MRGCTAGALARPQGELSPQATERGLVKHRSPFVKQCSQPPHPPQAVPLPHEGEGMDSFSFSSVSVHNIALLTTFFFKKEKQAVPLGSVAEGEDGKAVRGS